MKIEGSDYNAWSDAVNQRIRSNAWILTEIGGERRWYRYWWIYVYIAWFEPAISLRVGLGPVREQAEPTYGPVEVD